VGDRERDGARSGRKIEDARVGVARNPLQRELHERLRLGTRHEHRARNTQRQSPEFPDAGEVGDRLAFAAPLRECRERIGLRLRKLVVAVRDQPGALPLHDVREQHLRIDRIEPASRERFPHLHGRVAAYTRIVRP
jgi:hypothetical protein